MKPSPLTSTKRHPIVLAVGGAQRLAAEQVVRQPLVDLAEVEEFDFFAVLGHHVVDQPDDLVVADPVVRDGR